MQIIYSDSDDQSSQLSSLIVDDEEYKEHFLYNKDQEMEPE